MFPDLRKKLNVGVGCSQTMFAQGLFSTCFDLYLTLNLHSREIIDVFPECWCWLFLDTV